jgi:hypothetical protein
MLCAFISSDPPRLLQPNTQQSTSSDKGFDGQHRMGETGEENIPETQSRDKIGWHVRMIISLRHPSYSAFPVRYLEIQQYKPAIALIDTLLTELKRLDDKMILTEVHLLESRVYRGIGNLAKAKASLGIFSAVTHLLTGITCHHSGGFDVFQDCRQFYLLSSAPPSSSGLAVRDSPCRGQGLHNCLLIFLREFRKSQFARRPRCTQRSQVYAVMQNHAQLGKLSPSMKCRVCHP